MDSNSEIYKRYIETLKYLRTVPGTVYIDELKEKIKEVDFDSNSPEKCVVDINAKLRGVLDICKNDEPIINLNPHNYGLFTVPYARQFYDKIIHAKDEKYEYNRYLYEENPKGDSSLEDANLNINLINNSEIEISVDRNTANKIQTLKNFNLSQKIKDFLNNHGGYNNFSRITVKKFSFRGIVFQGETEISLPDDIGIDFICNCESDFQNTTFTDNVLVQNISFFFSVKEHNFFDPFVFNFRNTRFYKNLTMRNVSFNGNSSQAELSFEDARFSGDVNIYDVDFGDAKLNCFQCVLGNYFVPEEKSTPVPERRKFYIHNITFSSGGSIDFSNSEFRNALVHMRNIPDLPTTRMCFEAVSLKEIVDMTATMGRKSPDITLIVQECNINNVLFISNVSELSFYKTKNFGKIEEESDCADIYVNNQPIKIKNMNITSRITQAVYNNKYTDHFKNNDPEMINVSKCLDYVMLKENYLSSGMYDEEDNAFILYMDNKSYLDAYNKIKSTHKYQDTSIKKNNFIHCIYKFLNLIGDYGISPIKVIITMFVSIIVFSGIYFSLVKIFPYDQFSIGEKFETEIATEENNIETNHHQTAIKNSNNIEQLTFCLIYSAGNIVPFSSEFAPLSVPATIVVIIENFYGAFLIGYFSVAVVRKSLR